MIAGARFIEVDLNISATRVALVIFSLVIAAYVIAGGLKGVMYTDALQGSIMFIGMLVLLISSPTRSSEGFTGAHQALTDLADKVPEKMVAAWDTRDGLRCRNFSAPIGGCWSARLCWAWE